MCVESHTQNVFTFILGVRTNLMHSFLMYLFHASTYFEQQVLVIRKATLYYYIIWYNTFWWVTV
jgi:hypothetical protein